MNWEIFLSIFGTALAMISVIYGFMRNIRADIKSDFDKLDNRMEQLENRMFQLAMGKTFKEILLAEKLEEGKE